MTQGSSDHKYFLANATQGPGDPGTQIMTRADWSERHSQELNDINNVTEAASSGARSLVTL